MSSLQFHSFPNSSGSHPQSLSVRDGQLSTTLNGPVSETPEPSHFQQSYTSQTSQFQIQLN